MKNTDVPKGSVRSYLGTDPTISKLEALMKQPVYSVDYQFISTDILIKNAIVGFSMDKKKNLLFVLKPLNKVTSSDTNYLPPEKIFLEKKDAAVLVNEYLDSLKQDTK